jgi:phosphoglucosamine mutase
MNKLFGTDGVRGIANRDLTCELAMNIGRAAALILAEKSQQRPKIMIGKDTRLSSDMLEGSLAAGICSVGADVLLLNVVSTPAVAFLVRKYKADAGIMISASHNTFEFNGIKIFSGDGYKLPDSLEERIEAMLRETSENFPRPQGQDLGKVTTIKQADLDYIEHIKNTAQLSLNGLKIALDCANGSACRTADRLFRELGAECHLIACAPNGININENCGSTNLANLTAYVKENRLDAGFAFDGDADRCLAVDENGNLVDGDIIMAICAADMKARGKLVKNSVVGTVMTNMGFGKFCEENDINFISTKVGDRYVLEEMLKEKYSLGGEQSGHIIFLEFSTTGDGQLTAIQLLSIMKRKKLCLSALAKLMSKYPQQMINIKINNLKKAIFLKDPQIANIIESTNKKFCENGRVIVRVSGTEPLIRVMVEGAYESATYSMCEQIATTLQERIKDL